ncbi:MAG: histidine kinase, partial [Aeromicrobium sp.]
TIAGIVMIFEICVITATAVNDLRLADRGYGEQFDGLDNPWMWLWVVAILVPGFVGAVIVRSQPRQLVGWLFLTLSVSLLASALLDTWFTLATVVKPPELGGAQVAAILADKSFLPWWPLLALILLLTPTGTYLSPRWRLVGRTTVVATIVTFFLTIFGSAALNKPYDRVGNPWTSSRFGDAFSSAASWTFSIVALGLVLSGASLVLRWRRATGDARRQLLWLALVAIPLPAIIPVHLLAVRTESDWLILVTLLMFLTLIPVAAGLSVLRYRLYDVDRVVAATTTYSFLTFALTAIYAAVVWLGSQISTTSSPSPAATATVGAVTAATLAAPLRGGIQQRVDRRFNRRAFEAVRIVRQAVTVDRAGLDPELLLRTALADDSVSVAYAAADGWVDSDGVPAHPPVDDVIVTRGGRPVARIGYDRTQLEESTVARVGEAAAAELDNTRLRAELQGHLGELAESRARIAGAQRDERRRIERDLHDGAQQSLLALAFELQSAHLNGEPERMQTALAAGVTSARDAARQLRDLANGLHPQALAEGGLTAVLDDLAQHSSVPVNVTCPPDRFPAAVEFTCWLVIAESVVNAQKHAEAGQVDVDVARVDDALRIRVRDDGHGGADPESRGLRGLRDRVAAAGGRTKISSGSGGTSIEVTVPCAS